MLRNLHVKTIVFIPCCKDNSLTNCWNNSFICSYSVKKMEPTSIPLNILISVRETWDTPDVVHNHSKSELSFLIIKWTQSHLHLVSGLFYCSPEASILGKRFQVVTEAIERTVISFCFVRKIFDHFVPTPSSCIVTRTED